MLRRIVFVQLVSLLVAAGLATAAGASRPPSFSLPEQASEVAHGVFFLGQVVQDGVVLEGYAYARFATPAEVGRRGNAKPPWAGGGGGGGEADPATCYSFIANGAKWNTPEGYLFNNSNVTIGSVTATETNGRFGTWEAAAGTGIVLPGTETPDLLTADTTSTDGKNEIYFATITQANVLGYTIVWSTRSRGRLAGQIVESDMVIDDDGDWSWYTGSPSGIGAFDIDFWSVFTHEAGHWVGMGHTPDSDLCTAQTMYPSIATQDSSKRDLGLGDEAGISALY